MRLFLLAILSACLSAAPAAADQTDPRLDGLFAELRGGGALTADATIGRIIEIWSDAQSDTVDLLFQRASASLEAGDLPLALALLDHVVGLAPNFAQGHALRGAVRLRSGDQLGAVSDFARTIELEPRHFDVRMALAAILEGNGERREAYDMLQSALEWNPHDDDALRRAQALRDRLTGQDI